MIGQFNRKLGIFCGTSQFLRNLLKFLGVYQMNCSFLANELIKYFRNASIAATVTIYQSGNEGHLLIPQTGGAFAPLGPFLCPTTEEEKWRIAPKPGPYLHMYQLSGVNKFNIDENPYNLLWFLHVHCVNFQFYRNHKIYHKNKKKCFVLIFNH